MMVPVAVGFRRGTVAATWVTAVAFVLIGCADRPSRLVEPNIVLVSIDSLRAANLACYGYERDTSPFIDRLAREGVRFETAISTTSWTLPAHAAMFTGLYDHAHGVFDNGRALARRYLTLAEILKSRGYQTAGFYGGPYLHPTFGFDQGFDVYQSCMTTVDDDLSGDEVRAEASRRLGDSHRDVTGPRTLSEVERWVESGVGKPYFLFLHLWDVHYDYIPPRRYVDLFDPDYDGELSGADFVDNEAIHPGMPERDLEHLIALYDGEIRYTDEMLEQTFAVLEAHGLLTNTLTIITADHGEEFFEHNGKGHQRTLFDEVIRVPLIFHWPGELAAGGVVTDQVRLVDLLPTLARLGGFEGPLPVQGRDLWPLLSGGGLEPVTSLSELLVDGKTMRALRTNQLKLLKITAGQPVFRFELDKDPAEKWATAITPGAEANLETDEGSLLAELLKAETVGLAAQRRGFDRVEPDAELEERLRSLGYLDP